MPHQNQSKTTITIRALMICTLVFGTWFHPLDAYGMGSQQKIVGQRMDLLGDDEEEEDDVLFGLPPGQCVIQGIMRTGLGAEAISYQASTQSCLIYLEVDNVIPGGGWCSQWVVPNAPQYCVPSSEDSAGSDLSGVVITIGTCTDEEEGTGPAPDADAECSDNTGSPILLDLDRNQFHLSGGPVVFDIDADGLFEIVTWVSRGTQDAFLFLDRNGNGVVDDGSELFGDATLLTSGEQARHGYEALAEFDLVENGGNQDGEIDDADSIFSDLEVWIDSNANGIHESFESQSLAEAGVLTIGLNYRESSRTDSHGNEFRYIGRGSIEVDGRRKNMWTTDVFFKILAE